MAHFKTLLFDLDGTLVDAFTTIHRAYQYTLPLFGRPAPTRAEVRRAVGGGIGMAMAHFLPPELIPAAVQAHTEYTSRILLEDVILLPGALELIRAQHAQGAKLAVYTNKNGGYARRICTHLGLDPFLSGVFGAGDTPWLKPQREFSDHVLRALGADAATTLLIGDSPFDVATGQRAGFTAWCVTTGTHDAAQLNAAKADRLFPDLTAVARELAF